jgi:MFS family permease
MPPPSGRPRHHESDVSITDSPQLPAYFGAAVISNIGTWMQRVAQDWLVLQLTGSASALGVTVALQFLPFLLFGPWGGIAADRYSKRRLLAITQSTMGALALMLGVLVVTGAVQAWHVYVLAFLLHGYRARQSCQADSQSEIVGPSGAERGGLNSASFNLARLAGPAWQAFSSQQSAPDRCSR